MWLRDPPLGAFPSFRASGRDALCESVAFALGAGVVQMAKPTAPFEARGNRCVLPSSELWFCSYGLPITLRFGESDYLRVQIQRAGTATTRVGNSATEVTASQSALSSAEAEVDFGPGYQQIAWRLPQPTLRRALAALIDRPITQRIEFTSALDMTTPRSTGLCSILETLLVNIDTAPPNAAKLLLPELESALVVSLLCTADHTYRDLLDRPVPGAAPWQVYRAESYIEAHWNEPITIQELVSATGASARSIFRAFKKTRGYSPFQFAKQLRLRQASQLLSTAEPPPTVAEVAASCGFGDLSRFSKDFSAAYGEPPSALLNRRKSARR